MRLQDLTVVILNWNSAADASLAALSIPRGCGIVVVDNGSSDWPAEEEVLSRLSVPTTILRLEDNGGYAAGMNRGMRHSFTHGAQAVILLNADARLSDDAVAAMLSASEFGGVVGIAQARPTEDGTVEPYVTAAFGRSLTPRPFSCTGCPAGVHQVDMVSGAAMLVTRPAYELVGGMDEQFFHYKEEFDWVWRMRSAGVLVAWACRPRVQHSVGGSLPTSSPLAGYYAARNDVLFFRKHRTLWFLQPRLWVMEARRIRSARDSSRRRSIIAGIVHGVRGQAGRVDRPRRFSRSGSL